MNAVRAGIPRGIWILAGCAVLLRTAYMVASVDLTDDNYHEFGTIAQNLQAGVGYALFHYDGEALSPWFSEEESAFPSAFMPPGYVYFLYPFLELDDVQFRNVLLLLTQHLAGGFVVVLVFALTLRVFGSPAAWAAATLAAVMPDLVASTSTYGATVFVHLLVLGLFLRLETTDTRLTRTTALVLGCIMGALVLFRFEALAFVLLILLWLTVRAGAGSRSWVAAFVVLLAMVPWLARNAVVFGMPILSTSTGLNAYRGNNPEFVGAWPNLRMDAEMASRIPANAVETTLDKRLRSEAWNYAVSRPGETVSRSATKVFRLWSIDPSDERARHPIRLAGWFVVLVCSLVGMIRARVPGYIILYALYATAMAAVFFALLRHQVLLEIALIPVAGNGLARLGALIQKSVGRRKSKRSEPC